MEKFNINRDFEAVKGMTVFLKSGSPPLTITSVSGDVIHATWLDENNQVEKAGFIKACLIQLDSMELEKLDANKRVNGLTDSDIFKYANDIFDDFFAGLTEKMTPINIACLGEVSVRRYWYNLFVGVLVHDQSETNISSQDLASHRIVLAWLRGCSMGYQSAKKINKPLEQ